jgi:predicted HTH transcriptional regulator
MPEQQNITNKEYQEINNVSDYTSLHDMKTLIDMNIFLRVGNKKKIEYVLVDFEYVG